MTLGLSNNTGKPIDGWEYVYQMISDVLTTPIGSRVLRRDYGSRLHERIDEPMGPGLVADITADTAEAIAAWVPIFELQQVRVEVASAAGRYQLALEGQSTTTGENMTFAGIVI